MATAKKPAIEEQILFQFTSVKLTRNDRQRLEPHLSGWNRLNEMLLLGQFTMTDLHKLVALELEGRNRGYILNKIAQRLVTHYRTTLYAAIADAASKSCSNK